MTNSATRVDDKVNPDESGIQYAGRWQGKGSARLHTHPQASLLPSTPTTAAVSTASTHAASSKCPISRASRQRISIKLGASANWRRFSFPPDTFLIDHSNELVYIPDDGSFEFKGPSRAYGYEAKSSIDLTSHLSLNGGLTKIGNAFFRGGDHRVYVDSAPHFVANAGLTLAGYHGWSGSFRMRAINHYRLDGDDPSIVASGHHRLRRRRFETAQPHRRAESQPRQSLTIAITTRPKTTSSRGSRPMLL